MNHVEVIMSGMHGKADLINSCYITLITKGFSNTGLPAISQWRKASKCLNHGRLLNY